MNPEKSYDLTKERSPGGDWKGTVRRAWQGDTYRKKSDREKRRVCCNGQSHGGKCLYLSKKGERRIQGEGGSGWKKKGVAE